MPTAYLAFGDSQIHFASYGKGSQLIFCFHGYGESCQSFAFLEKDVAESCTLVAIDFPHHGDTLWPDDRPLQPEDLMDILDRIKERFFPEGRVTGLMGYSMGGRIALSLYHLRPERFRYLILIAPDGLVVNGWYRLATQTTAGMRLFRFTMNHPGFFFRILQAAHLLGLVNQSVYKFVHQYVDDRKARLDLYQRWTCLRFFRPPLNSIRQDISRFATLVHLFYGRYDRIIRFERGMQFRTGIEPFCSLHILDCGHQILHLHHAGDLAKAIPS